MSDSFTVRLDSADQTTAVFYRAEPPSRNATLILAHGAGAPQTSAFIVTFAEDLAGRGLDVVTFNFPYMEAGRRLPDPPARLEACWRSVVEAVRGRDVGANRVFLSGKSLGGRIASHIAAGGGETATQSAGLILLGYPLHPPGKPEKLRTAHLARIAVPMLFIQGSRDPFGSPDELRPVFEQLAAPASLHIVEGGDHSFSTPRRMGLSKADVFASIQERMIAWIDDLAAPGA
ncbi:MAG: alpha/beta hydrolase family protein [Acidobacteriota bacterium]